MKYFNVCIFFSAFILFGAGCQIAQSPVYQCERVEDCQLGIIEDCSQPCPSCDNLDATDKEVEAFSRAWCQEQRAAAKEENPDVSCAACIGSIEHAELIEVKCVNSQCQKK